MASEVHKKIFMLDVSCAMIYSYFICYIIEPLVIIGGTQLVYTPKSV